MRSWHTRRRRLRHMHISIPLNRPIDKETFDKNSRKTLYLSKNVNIPVEYGQQIAELREKYGEIWRDCGDFNSGLFPGILCTSTLLRRPEAIRAAQRIAPPAKRAAKTPPSARAGYRVSADPRSSARCDLPSSRLAPVCFRMAPPRAATTADLELNDPDGPQRLPIPAASRIGISPATALRRDRRLSTGNARDP
jgi:hypothetical protein